MEYQEVQRLDLRGIPMYSQSAGETKAAIPLARDVNQGRQQKASTSFRRTEKFRQTNAKMEMNS